MITLTNDEVDWPCELLLEKLGKSLRAGETFMPDETKIKKIDF